MTRQHDQAFSIGGLELLASMLAIQNNMRVVFSGDKTCIDMHSKPMTIYLPNNLANTEKNRLLINAKIDHEAAHGRFSSLWVENWHSILNRLEDIRIERLMGERYPGCKMNFSQYQKTLKPKLLRTSTDLMMNIGLMITYDMRSEILHHDLADFAEEAKQAVLKIIPVDIVDSVMQLCREASLSGSTEFVSDKVKEILSLLLVDPPNDDQPNDNSGSSEENSVANADEQSTNEAEGEDNSSADEDAASSDDTNESDASQSTKNSDTDVEADATHDNQGGVGDDSGLNDDATDASENPSNEQSNLKTEENSSSGEKTVVNHDQHDVSNKDDWRRLIALSDTGESADSDEAILDMAFDREYSKHAQVNETPHQRVDKYPVDVTNARSATNLLRSQLEGLLQAETYTDEMHATIGGRLDKRVLHTLKTPNPKPFLREIEGHTLSTSVLVLVDASGSMQGKNNTIANESAFALCEAMSRIQGVECACAHFRGNEVILAKSFEEQVKPAQFGVMATGSTPMSMALHWSFLQLWPRSKDRKIVLFLTDGDVSNDVVAKIGFLKKHGIECYGIGLNKSLENILPAVQQNRISDVSDLPKAMFKMLRHALFGH